MRNKTSINDKGHTLIELVIVMIIISILFGVGGPLIASMFDAYFTIQDLTPIPQSMRITSDSMTRALREAQWDSIEQPDGVGSIRFTNNSSGLSYQYDQLGNNGSPTNVNSIYLHSVQGGSALTGIPMLDDVKTDSLKFTLDDSKHLVTIEFTIVRPLTMSKGAGSVAEIPFRTAINVRM